MGKRVKDWLEFADMVAEHVEETERGHYAGAEEDQPASIDTMEYVEGFFGILSIVAWIKDVIKYTSRFYRTRNPVDLYKAANFLGRIYHVTAYPQIRPRQDGAPRGEGDNPFSPAPFPSYNPRAG